MANEEQLSILKQGVEVWNEWRKENPDVEIDLSGVNLFKTDLSKAMLSRADLRKANLRKTIAIVADLSDANLSEADLSGANLSGANLTGTNLRDGSLIDANLKAANLNAGDLRGTDLKRTYFTTTRLAGSNFQNAVVNGTIFGNVNLSEVIGLEGAIHLAPSSISTDTFSLSKGKIPETFLRGCGLSDWEIEQVKLYNPNLSNDEFIDIQNKIFDLHHRQALQIAPLFISYSHADNEFVDKIGNELTKKGIRYWRDIHDMKAGRMETQIDRAISQNPTVLLVLSKHSLRSDWVEHEVRTARGLEKDMGRDVLCPIALDDSWKSSPWPSMLWNRLWNTISLIFPRGRMIRSLGICSAS